MPQKHYLYVSNQPDHLIDSTGLYEEDFHFYGVFFLARAAGFSHHDAYEIAGASQYTDDNSLSGPPIGYFTPGGIAKLMRFHFVPDPARTRATLLDRLQVTEANQVVQGFVREAIRTGDNIAVGIEIHALADTFSHASYVGKDHPLNIRTTSSTRTGAPACGHARAAFGGHEPDLPWIEPEKALNAARAVYNALIQYAESRGLEPRVRFEYIQSSLETIFKSGKVSETEYDHKKNLETRIREWKRHMRNDRAFYVNGVMDVTMDIPHYDKKHFEKLYQERFEKRIREIMNVYRLP